MSAKSSQTSKSNTSHGAQTMEELLSNAGYTPKGLTRGETVIGTVVEIGPKALILDIGAKSEGIVSEREFESARAYIKTLKVGDTVTAAVVTPEGEGGYSLLSLREAGDEFVWKALEEKLKTGEETDAKVENATRGGLTVYVMGVEGFIPSSHLGGDLSQSPAGAVGKNISVRVIEIDRSKGRVVASEKAVSEKEFLQKQAELLKSIKAGEKFTGRVTKVMNFGVFVEIVKDGVPVEGLVHLSEIAWGKTSDPSELYAEGDEIEVVVINREKDKLALSIKQLQENPWEANIGKYEKDQQVSGRVTKVGDFGAFIELEPGVEGLIRSDKIHSERKLSEGQEVKVIIDSLDKKNKKLSLVLALTSVPVGYR